MIYKLTLEVLLLLLTAVIVVILWNVTAIGTLRLTSIVFYLVVIRWFWKRS